MQIEPGQVVTLIFQAHDTDGNLIERQDQPVAYLHGHGNFLDKVEAAIAGMSGGDQFEVAIEDAYGPALTTEPVAVPKKEFPRNWTFEVGMGFTAPGSQGNTATLYVHSTKGSRVLVSPEHPWGGKKVVFTGQILSVRASTLEERRHGHAHGPGGHHHH